MHVYLRKRYADVSDLRKSQYLPKFLKKIITRSCFLRSMDPMYMHVQFSPSLNKYMRKTQLHRVCASSRSRFECVLDSKQRYLRVSS